MKEFSTFRYFLFFALFLFLRCVLLYSLNQFFTFSVSKPSFTPNTITEITDNSELTEQHNTLLRKASSFDPGAPDTSGEPRIGPGHIVRRTTKLDSQELLKNTLVKNVKSIKEGDVDEGIQEDKELKRSNTAAFNNVDSVQSQYKYRLVF